MPYKTIKEICSATGITESALRYYDEKCLLSPDVKKQSGRREWLYDECSIWKLKLIMLYRKIGISVDEIKSTIIEFDNITSAMLEKKLEELRKEKDKLDKQISLAEVMILIENISEGDRNQESRKKLIDELIKKGGEKK